MSTLTSANCSFALAITNLYPTPQTIDGFSADDGFSASAIETKETAMDLGGTLHFGYKFNPTDLTLLIYPDSPSLTIFQTWVNAEAVLKDVYTANGTIKIPSISMKFTLTNGGLLSHKPFPDVKKMLQPMPFVIRWQSIVGAQL